MTEPDIDEQVAIEGEPEQVFGELLETDPGGDCSRCGHANRVHHVTPHGRREGVTCDFEDCGCHYEQLHH